MALAVTSTQKRVSAFRQSAAGSCGLTMSIVDLSSDLECGIDSLVVLV
eukprot:SAG11_NODE_28564_length_320_cov_0.923077_1_plen_48_part_00